MECGPQMFEPQVCSSWSLSHQRAERIIELLVGGLFLLTGVFKSWGVVGFVTVISNLMIAARPEWLPAAVPVALAVLGWEVLLGACLVLGVRPAIFLPATLLTLGVFSAVFVRIWMNPTLENCGCMGSISILGDRFAHPAFGLARNVVLMALVAFAWHRRSTAPAK